MVSWGSVLLCSALWFFYKKRQSSKKANKVELFFYAFDPFMIKRNPQKIKGPEQSKAKQSREESVPFL
jgi:hypothetical protein